MKLLSVAQQNFENCGGANRAQPVATMEAARRPCADPREFCRAGRRSVFRLSDEKDGPAIPVGHFLVEME
jgi:hypothetical protein